MAAFINLRLFRMLDSSGWREDSANGEGQLQRTMVVEDRDFSAGQRAGHLPSITGGLAWAESKGAYADALATGLTKKTNGRADPLPL